MVALILMVAMNASTETSGPAAGVVAATVGPVELRRDAEMLRALPRSGLAEGDLLRTAEGGGAALLLDDRHLVHIGPSSAVRIGEHGGRRTLELVIGEVRVTSEGGLTVSGPSAQARIGRGIARVVRNSGGVRVGVESGAVEVIAGSGPPRPVSAGSEMLVDRSGRVVRFASSRSEDWAIRPEDLLQAAAGSSRQHKQRPSGQSLVPTPPGSEPPIPSPILPGTPIEEGEGVPPTPNEEAAPIAALPPTPDATAGPAGPTSTEETFAFDTPSAYAQPASSPAIALSLGNVSGTTATGVSGGLFTDAQQDSRNLAFPGNIHLVSAETRYVLDRVFLRPSDLFPSVREYYSIGLGTPPTDQVVTTFRTASDPVPFTIQIPRFGAYLVRLPESQYGVPDPANANNAVVAQGIAGLIGVPPTAPQVRNATPLPDPRAAINDRATFALGEFAVDRTTDRRGRTLPVIELRRSDQDRAIVKAPDGNDQQDQVTPNPDVSFSNRRDPRFFPDLPSVKVPAVGPGVNTLNNAPEYSRLGLLRRAAATTLVGDRLSGYAARTGQTRFTFDGRTVVDITGFRPGAQGIRPLSRVPADLLRGGAAGPLGARAGFTPARLR